jgi:hypothetical protein
MVVIVRSATCLGRSSPRPRLGHKVEVVQKKSNSYRSEVTDMICDPTRITLASLNVDERPQQPVLVLNRALYVAPTASTAGATNFMTGRIQTTASVVHRVTHPAKHPRYSSATLRIRLKSTLTGKSCQSGIQNPKNREPLAASMSASISASPSEKATGRKLKRFAPLNPDIKHGRDLPRLKGIIFDVDGTLW